MSLKIHDTLHTPPQEIQETFIKSTVTEETYHMRHHSLFKAIYNLFKVYAKVVKVS